MSHNFQDYESSDALLRYEQQENDLMIALASSSYFEGGPVGCGKSGKGKYKVYKCNEPLPKRLVQILKYS